MGRRSKSIQRPDVIPVFAVAGAIVLPGGRVPLVVFEPRYLAMVDDVLGQGRVFGLIQPRQNVQQNENEELHAVGTLVRITAFAETGDGRYLITVAGLTRFRVAEKVEADSPYVRVVADYSPYLGDGEEMGVMLSERERLVSLLGAHLTSLGLDAQLQPLQGLPDGELADRMAMVCPFRPEEKQVLLEAPTHAERCRLMIAIIQRDMLSENGGGSTLH